LEKVGLFWKKPYFFFKRLKLDNLKKSRAFSKKALLFPEKALLFRLKLRTPAFSKDARLFNHTGYTQYVLKKLGLFHHSSVGKSSPLL
jgi:hypothetical protein